MSKKKDPAELPAEIPSVAPAGADEKKPGAENASPRWLSSVAEGRAKGAARADAGGQVEILVANRRAGQSNDRRKRARELAEKTIQSLASGFDVLTSLSQQQADGRRISRLRGSVDEVRAKVEALDPAEVIIEKVVPRRLARAAHPLFAGLPDSPPADVGEGRDLEFRLRAGSEPVPGAAVTVYLRDAGGAVSSKNVRSDAAGRVAFSHSPDLMPLFADLEPAGGAWSMVVASPQSGAIYQLPVLALEGPTAWWHLLLGENGYSEKNGQGIRIGVADTGSGPHPFLDHVAGIGAFVGGVYHPSATATRDIGWHGTHVCGVIGARPTASSKGYGGLAPGAELFCARVFGDSEAGNDDIAAAVDDLSEGCRTDLINLSLGGDPSIIEADAIAYAFENGTLCICAAGNNYGGAVMAPASLPYTAAVSAIGMFGQYPPGSLSAQNVPSAPALISRWGLFLANFSAIGSQLKVTGPGNGIVSTVPANPYHAAPYAPHDGTSAAAPAVTGALARLLAGSETYKRLPRDGQRSLFALGALRQAAVDIGLSPLYQGWGLARSVLL